MQHRHLCLVFAAVSASLLACSVSTETTSAPGAGPDPVEPGTPDEDPGTPSDTDPPETDVPAKPPTLKADSTFAGGSGISESTHEIYAAAPGASGATYVALRKAGGSIGWGSGTLLRRYLANGALDASFATKGELDTALVANPRALATDAGGNVLVGGTGLYDPDRTNDTGNEIVVVRVSPAGAVDATYGAGGRAKLSFSPANVWTTALRVRSDGGAFVAVYGRTNGKDSFGGFLVGPTGAAVTGFGTAGFTSSPFPLDGAVALGNDVAVPTTSGLARYGQDGAKKGFAIEDGVAMAKTAPDGSFIAVVSDGQSLSFARFSAGGAKDAAFAESKIPDDLTDFLPLAGGGVLVSDGADLSWIGPKGGAATKVLSGAAAAKLEATADGKILVMTVASKPKVMRYTL